jgi:hypothetical protein
MRCIGGENSANSGSICHEMAGMIHQQQGQHYANVTKM